MDKNQPERGMRSEEEAPENSPFTYPVCNTEFSNLEVDLAWTTGNGSQKAKQQLEIFAVEIISWRKKDKFPQKELLKSHIRMKATVIFSYNLESIFVNKLMFVSKRRSFSCRNYWEFPLTYIRKNFSLVDWTQTFLMSPNRCRHRSKVIPR